MYFIPGVCLDNDRGKEHISHDSQMDCHNLSQSATQNINPKSRHMQTKMIPQNQVSNHMKDSTNTDDNRFPNMKPKV